MAYSFLVDSYETERLKTLNVWSMFRDEELSSRLESLPRRDRNPLEHMIHQCLSEDKWFRTMFSIDVGLPPLPTEETRLAFIEHYAEVSARRLAELKVKDKAWWDEVVDFFEVRRSRAWIMVRRIAHTAHHRGEQTTLLRLLSREVHSVYGPSVDTGGLPDNGAVTIYAYPNAESLIKGEAQGGAKTELPGPGDQPSTERPDL